MENLPVCHLDSAAKLRPLIDEISHCPVVGLDTEFISEGRYDPELCLVQIATEKGIWIVDPLRIADLRPLWDTLAQPERELVAVAARQEIRFCAKGAARSPAKVLDLQIAAGLVGYGYPLSHTNLVLRTLGEKIHGGESFTDWRRRPLAQVQLKYAADDVRYLLGMRARLLRRAEQMGRLGWIGEECRQLVEEVMNEQEKWRVSGSARLNRRQLAALREVWRWRDGVAQERNMPATRVLSDSMLVEVARRSPVSIDDLFAIRGLDRRLLRDAEGGIVRAVKAAQALPETQLPANERRDDPPQVAVLAKLLSVAAGGLAAEHDVDPALLATTADLQELVRWFLHQDGMPKPSLLEGWRANLVAGPLLGFLSGERCVRVGNVKRSNPLLFDEWKPR
ncbi:MAG: HRDC domain-containing protein, partial [Candidatus Korobacteraceae bacterium]